MGLRATVASAVAAALNSIGDIAETITYRQRTDGSYNTATGAVGHTDTDISVKAIVTPSGSDTVDPNMIIDEHTPNLSVLVKASDMTVTPDTGDQVVRGGLIYLVNQIIFDPAGATYQFTVSKQG